ADALRALDTDAVKLRERTEAAVQARSYHDIISARYEAGGGSFLSLLHAQRKLRGARLEQAQAIADRYPRSPALLQARCRRWAAAGGRNRTQRRRSRDRRSRIVDVPPRPVPEHPRFRLDRPLGRHLARRAGDRARARRPGDGRDCALRAPRADARVYLFG